VVSLGVSIFESPKPERDLQLCVVDPSSLFEGVVRSVMASRLMPDAALVRVGGPQTGT
jgi:hypothetical protein